MHQPQRPSVSQWHFSSQGPAFQAKGLPPEYPAGFRHAVSLPLAELFIKLLMQMSPDPTIANLFGGKAL